MWLLHNYVAPRIRTTIYASIGHLFMTAMAGAVTTSGDALTPSKIRTFGDIRLFPANGWR